MRSIPPQTVHHRSLRPLRQSMQGYLDKGLQLHAMSEAVVPVTEVEVEVEQTLAPRTISTSETSLGADRLFAWLTATKQPTPSELVVLALNNLGEKRIEFPRESWQGG